MQKAQKKPTIPVSTRLLLPEHKRLINAFGKSDCKDKATYIHDAIMEKIKKEEEEA